MWASNSGSGKWFMRVQQDIFTRRVKDDVSLSVCSLLSTLGISRYLVLITHVVRASVVCKLLLRQKRLTKIRIWYSLVIWLALKRNDSTNHPKEPVHLSHWAVSTLTHVPICFLTENRSHLTMIFLLFSQTYEGFMTRHSPSYVHFVIGKKSSLGQFSIENITLFFKGNLSLFWTATSCPL